MELIAGPVEGAAARLAGAVQRHHSAQRRPLALVPHALVRPGDRIGLAVNPAKVRLFDQAAGARLAA